MKTGFRIQYSEECTLQEIPGKRGSVEGIYTFTRLTPHDSLLTAFTLGGDTMIQEEDFLRLLEHLDGAKWVQWDRADELLYIWPGGSEVRVLQPALATVVDQFSVGSLEGNEVTLAMVKEGIEDWRKKQR